MAVALFPLAGYSLGLGKLELKSALNEPLRAEIEITSATEAELSDLKVSLASRADFELAGAERLPLLSQIKFAVRQRHDGTRYIELTTRAPIQEPFLHMLLQIEWPNGRLVREYTALLDPPSYVAGRPAGIEAPQTAPAPPPVAPSARAPGSVRTVPPPEASGEVVPVPQTVPGAPTPVPPLDERLRPMPSPLPGPSGIARAPAPQALEPAAPSSAPAQEWATVTEYTVRPGDTLWSIAERVRTDRGMTLEQVMLAIFRNNPDAFHLDNMNYMFAGKVLEMPAREDVQAIGAVEARREFRAQYAAWREYKTQLAARAAALKVAESEAPAAPAPEAGKAAEAEAAGAADEAEARPKPAKPPETAKAAGADEGKAGASSGEMLRIVRAPDAKEEAGDGGAESESLDPEARAAREQAALAERVATLDESLASKQLEHRELSEKVGQVRSQIENEKRLIELENEALARQTGKPAPAEAKAPAPADKAGAEAKAAPAPAAPAKAAPAKPKPKPKPAAKPAPPPAPEQSLMATMLDDLLHNPFLPMIGGAVVLVAGLILMVYVRRRRRSIAEFEESILASDGVTTDGVTATETGTQPPQGDTSFLSDFSKSGMGQMHTDEVDPIAEAEVYLAYGRDETAEEILREAIIKNPERHELKQKLLEIYHQRNDVQAFETLAEELYAALGGPGGKIWAKVEEMGRRLNPDNPMFRGGGHAPSPAGVPAAPPPPAAPLVDEAATIALDTGHAAGAPGAASDALEFEPPAATVSLDTASDDALSLDMPGGDKDSIEFSVDEPSAGASGEAVPTTEPAPGDGLDFDLGSTEPVDQGASDSGGEAPDAPGADETLELSSSADNLIDFESARQEAHSPAETGSTGAQDGDDDIKWEMDVPVEEAAAAETAGDDGADDGDGNWDETATKLDLARAYIDMGDAEGARNILEEVMAEGNEEQKQQAADLVAQIA